MAEVLKAHKFTRPSRVEAYPWEKWLDGQVWLIVGGLDFVCSPATFVQTAISAAKDRGTTLLIERQNNDIIIQGESKWQK